MDQPVTEEAILPRLMASNALRANLSKHMTLNQMADHKASMIMTTASLMLTISVTQYDKLGLQIFAILMATGGAGDSFFHLCHYPRFTC
jgi:predicted membrane channel-forming protein YqfA (hemolysin III family)